jgi:hypothetical protein
MDILPVAFHALKNYHQFIVYSLTENPTNASKKIKKPVHPLTGKTWDAHDSAIWSDFESASTACKFLGDSYGVGFVITESDPFFLLDIDSCYDQTTGWSDLSKTLLQKLAGAAVEVSASGKGLHVIGTCQQFEHGCRNDKLGLEFYTTKRFIALTGIHASGDASLDCTEALKDISSTYFISSSSTPTDKEWWSTEPVPEYTGPTDDAELIKMAIACKTNKSRFGKGASFQELWEGDEEALSKFYPPDSTSSEPYNRSSVDAALAQHLAFWTGCNAERMVNLLRQSKLYRDKWDREDYLPRTVRNARGKCTNVYSKQPKQNSIKSDSSSQIIGTMGNSFLTLQEQLEYFKRCVYICHENMILVPGGYLLDRERFNVMYGGYTFITDAANAKTTNKAWDAFTMSTGMRFPRVNSCTFRPDLKPAAVFNKDGELVVNTYWPYQCVAEKGDVSKFLEHLERLFPDKRDQDIILNYLAALVQYIGKKFKWCIVLQGTQGNGKTFLSRIISYVVGDRYTQFPRADEIASKFNDWEDQTLFVSIEDAYYPDSRAEIMEALKPMLDLERRMIEGKGKKKIMKDICWNAIINTNHKEALRKSKDDRRFAVFYTAQQSVEDLYRDDMMGDYFPDLYNWANNGGYAAIADFLMNYPIRDEFSPLKCTRAPTTSSTEAAIQHGWGRVEHEFVEAIESEKIGFKGGWISSTSIDALLKDIGADKRIARNKRRELMKSLGYDWHPGLREGRCPTIMPGESSKPRLYIEINHPDRGLTDSKQIISAYKEAQK